jgi:hypothetical protein
VVYNPLNLALLLQVSDGNAGETSVDFQALDENALADEPEGRNFLDDTVVGRLVKGDGVLSLILDFSLRPLLFLCGFTARRCRRSFSFGHDLGLYFGVDVGAGIQTVLKRLLPTPLEINYVI